MFESRGRGRPRHTTARGYNDLVPAVSPQSHQPAPERPPKAHIYKLEAGGILIIGAVVLLLILARYWHHIAWGAR